MEGLMRWLLTSLVRPVFGFDPTGVNDASVISFVQKKAFDSACERMTALAFRF